MPRGNTGEDVRTIAGPWEGRRGLEERLATKSPTLELKAVEALGLWLQSSPQVAKSQSRKVASGRHPARERSSARIGLRSPGRRCLPRAATGDQHTPQTADRKYGADSMGVGDSSSGEIY